MGINIRDGIGASNTDSPGVPLPLTLGSVSVTVDGPQLLCCLYHRVKSTRSFRLKHSSPQRSRSLLRHRMGPSTAFNIRLVRTAPAVFTQNAQGTGNALAFDARFQAIASVGSDMIVLYATGLGPVDPALPSSASGGASAEPLNRIRDYLASFDRGIARESTLRWARSGTARRLPGERPPTGNPTSNRVVLSQNAMFSNSATLPIPGGANVTNVSGSIDGLYPASLLSGEWHRRFARAGDLRTCHHLSDAGDRSSETELRHRARSEAVQDHCHHPSRQRCCGFDPATKAYMGRRRSRQAQCQNVRFFVRRNHVYDLKTGARFPGNIVPPSRMDSWLQRHAPDALSERATIPDSANGILIISGVLPDDGHVSIGSDLTTVHLAPFAFGGFFDLGLTSPPVRTAQFALLVDGMLIASRNVVFEVYSNSTTSVAAKPRPRLTTPLPSRKCCW